VHEKYKEYNRVRCNLVVQKFITNISQDATQSDQQDNKVELMPILT